MKFKSLIIAILLVVIFVSVRELNTKEKDFKTNPSINLGYGWDNLESSYSGSELSFIFDKSDYVAFNFTSKTKAEQGVEILIDNNSYTLQSPNLQNQKLTVSVDKNKSHSVTVRYLCVRFNFPCKIMIGGIFLESSAKILPYQAHSKTLTVLGDSISTIYGKNNYTHLLATDLGYELRDASIIQSTVSPVKGIDNAIDRYKKDLLSFKSDATVIFMGTNDAGNNVPLDTFEKNYGKIVKNLKKFNSKGKIFLVAPLPRKDIDKSTLDAYNSVIKNIASEYNTYYIDPSDWLSDFDFSDDIHPSQESQVKIADNFNKFMGPILK